MLVDDHPMLIEGVRRVLEVNPDLEVTAVVTHGDQVLPTLAKVRCDVVVLDISIPGLHGFELLRRIKEDFAAVNVVAFSASAEEQYGVRLVRAGALAYLSKSRHASELVTAIRRAAAGQKYLTDVVADQLVQAGPETRAMGVLSDRELEVLRLLVEGHQPLAISRTLGIGPSTVSSHLAHIREKLNARSNHELVRTAIEQRLLAPTSK